MLKDDIRALLENEDYDGLKALYEKKGAKVTRQLISLSYDKFKTSAWRAIKAVGILSAMLDIESRRESVQKLLWMMRDESGGNAWSAPEILGEIVLNTPGELEDIIPILGSFHEEAFFLPAVLRGLTRIATVRPGIVYEQMRYLGEYLSSDDPVVLGNLAMLLAQTGADGYGEGLKQLAADEREFPYFNESVIAQKTVGEAAREAMGAAGQ